MKIGALFVKPVDRPIDGVIKADDDRNLLTELEEYVVTGEVAKGLPTAITLACTDAGLGQKLVEALGTASFRPYLSDDLVGAQMGGAVKNVLAIACGIVEGRGLGPLDQISHQTVSWRSSAAVSITARTILS